MKKDIARKRRIFTHSAILTFCFISLVLAVVRCAELIKANYLEQLEQNLKDVADQNAEALKVSVDFCHSLLKSVGTRFEIEPEKREENLYMFKPVVEAFDLKRIGYIDKDGFAHATEGNVVNLSYREFFQKSIKGIPCISDDVRDAMDSNHEHVVVLSNPLYDSSNGEINGVVCVTYKTENLSRDLSIQSFEGYGSTFVFNESNTVVISSDPNLIAPYDNILDFLWAENGKNYETRNDLIEDIIDYQEDSNHRQGTFLMNGDSYYYNVAPVSLMDDAATWHVLSVVPTSYLDQRFHATRRNLVRMLVIVVCISSLAIVFISLQKKHRQKLIESLAFRSSVTHGHNLEFFTRILNKNHVTEGYLVSMGIKDFKNTSLVMGKVKTRHILQAIWNILFENEGDDDLFCHENNDSFIMYMTADSETQLRNRLVKFSQRIMAAAEEQHLSYVKVKYGIYKLEGPESADSAVKKAGLALQDAYESSMFYSYYDRVKHELQLQNQEYEQYLQEALDKEEFVIYYQPKYSVDENVLTGCEALVRWMYKGEKFISPADFIPLFERNGKIHLLDTYVFKHVCQQISEWKKAGLPVVPVSVNLSKSSLFRPHTVEKYLKFINGNGISPRDIQIEVTETLFSAGEHMAELLNTFREKGIKILLDDFGQGDTALGVLTMNCFDTLKIDKCLVDKINDPFCAKLLSGIMGVAHDLGYHLTCEGVEKTKQVEFLKDTPCDDIQGWFFAKAKPVDEYTKCLEELRGQISA